MDSGVEQRGGITPPRLTVPDVNLSAHPAPIDQPGEARPVASERKVQAAGALCAGTSEPLASGDPATA